MRGSAWAALVLALCACGDDEGDEPVTDASVRLDGSQLLDATLIQKCGPVLACQNGAITQLPELCTGSIKAQPNGGSWKVCVVDPQGRASYIQIRDDERITSPGWTHSNYGFVDGTLSDQGVDACLEQRSKQIIATRDNQPDAGNLLCYRGSAGNDDD